MARHKNVNWILPGNDTDSSVPNETVRNALLMDIRDELRQLNRVFACGNFLRMPADLAQIKKNTTKRKYRRLANGQRKLA